MLQRRLLPAAAIARNGTRPSRWNRQWRRRRWRPRSSCNRPNPRQPSPSLPFLTSRTPPACRSRPPRQRALRRNARLCLLRRPSHWCAPASSLRRTRAHPARAADGGGSRAAAVPAGAAYAHAEQYACPACPCRSRRACRAARPRQGLAVPGVGGACRRGQRTSGRA